MKHINDFLNHLKNQNYSNKTIRDYKYILADFQKYLRTLQITDEKNVSESHFKDYIRRYKDCGKHSIYYKSVTIIKKYFRFLEEFNHIFISPIERIKNPKQVVKHHPIMSKKEMLDILDDLKSDSPFDIRTRAMIELLYSSALRPGECLNLNITDINFQGRIILIKKTKTKTDRIVPVTKEALYWINKYMIKVRNKSVGIKDNNKLFISFHSRKGITVKGMNSSLRYLFSTRNIKRFSLYSIRATSATHLFENGMSISYLQLLLGHKDLRATQVYVRVSFIMLKELLKQKHPRNKLKDKTEAIGEISEVH